MAKLELTERQKRWRDVMRLYNDIISDPQNDGKLLKTVIYRTIGGRLHIPSETVRGIINRHLAAERKEV